MKKLTVGLLAHVDAGKTTLAESLLFTAGEIRTQGRVDSGNTAMDTHELEKTRGITIFTGESSFLWKNAKIQLLDTPGHLDFSAEAERSLRALDLGLVVISGLDGVQAHTLTLWKLLHTYQIPTALFVTKMDLNRLSEAELMSDLKKNLGPDLVRADLGDQDLFESCALCDEAALEKFTKTGALEDTDLSRLLFGRCFCPVFFGSGLKNQGVEILLNFLTRMAPDLTPAGVPTAYVYKITYDKNGNRLTHAKMLTGSLKVRESVRYETENGEEYEEKINLMEFPKGEKRLQTDVCEAGDTVLLQGLTRTYSGQMLNAATVSSMPVLSPIMSYQVLLPQGDDPKTAFPKLLKLCEEDPTLHLRHDSENDSIRLDLMGDIQTEVLKSLALSRFGLTIDFCEGEVLYRETIAETVEGIGHYEPLRHYAEVHVLLEPTGLGSGLSFVSDLSLDELEQHWQRLILTHLKERTHRGVLIGAPITDIRFHLVRGKAHEKHTEGGDFRQATYRAVRQGLRQAHSLLLEPYYAFRLEVPTDQLGRAMTDLKLRHAEINAPEMTQESSLLTGRAPVVCLNGYAREVNAYTGGKGRLSLEPDGYDIAHNEEEIIARQAYNPDADPDHTADSVFCSHGAGHVVPWNEVQKYMHLPASLSDPERPTFGNGAPIAPDDESLEAIMLREFGPIKRPMFTKEERTLYQGEDPVPVASYRNTLFVIDGYNLLFSCDDLRPAGDGDFEFCRDRLLRMLADYQGFSGNEVAVVFDGYRVKGNLGEKGEYCNVRVAFTKEHETADAYIERFVQELGKETRVRVVTSDALIQLSALRSGVLRMSSREFKAELDRVLGELAKYMKNNQK